MRASKEATDETRDQQKDQPRSAVTAKDSTTTKSNDSGGFEGATFETDLSAPRGQRTRDRAVAYQGDAKYQKYVQLVERNLQSFEYVGEWADVTAFLTKLGRSFEMYGRFATVPHKETVAKRLAQCLNPALPTGVHQKALGIYDRIFGQIGAEQLEADLGLYMYGLMGFMRNASVQGKSQLLDIVERHVLPLGGRLRPCMKSLTAGLSAGLEEGTVEVAERVTRVLDGLRGAVEESFFFQTLFLALVTNAEQREAMLKYLGQRLVGLGKSGGAEQMGGSDGAALLVRGLSAALADSRGLVVRAALDVVVAQVPLASAAEVAATDRALLTRHAAAVAVRKDMSLNRRLYTWLVGAGETEAEQATHMAAHALSPLAAGLLAAFAAGAETEQQTVLRVLAALQDRAVISQPLVQAVFVPLLRLLMAQRPLSARLGSVARQFVEMLDPRFTWASVVGEVTGVAENFNSEALESVETVAQDEDTTAPTGEITTLDEDAAEQGLQLVLFFVQTFELDDEATLQVHVPMALVAVLAALDRMQQSKCSAELASRFTRTAVELLARVPQTVFSEGTEANASVDADALFGTVCAFYGAHTHGDTAAADIIHGAGLVSAIAQLAQRVARHVAEKGAQAALEDACHILRTTAAYACDVTLVPAACTADGAWVAALAAAVQHGQLAAACEALTTLTDFAERGLLATTELLGSGRLAVFVERMWTALGPAHPTSHTRATRLLWRLRVLDAAGVERLLAARLSVRGADFASELARFAALWHGLPRGSGSDALAFARLLLLTLDAAAPCDPCAGPAALRRHAAARAWVETVGSECEHVIAVLAALLHHGMGAARTVEAPVLAGHTAQRIEYAAAFDTARVGYYAVTIQRFVYLAGTDAVCVLAAPGAGENETRSWLHVLAATAANVALADVSASSTPDERDAVELMRTQGADLAAFLIARPGVAWPAAFVGALQRRTVDALLFSVLHGRTAIQPPLLDLLAALTEAQVDDAQVLGGDESAATTSIVKSSGPAPVTAGLALLGDVRVFARLVLAALTMQLDAVALGRWARFVAATLPHMQPLLERAPGGGLLQLLVLPCLQALRLVLRQCAACFSRLNGITCTCPRYAQRLLHTHLSPIFVVSVDAPPTPDVGVDVLLALLDIFDALLTLCLRNSNAVTAATAADLADNTSNSIAGVPLAAIPIVSFASNVFGDESDLDNPDSSKSVPSETDPDETNTDEASMLMNFGLVQLLAVLQDVWNAYDVDDAIRHDVRAVRGRITNILAHAEAAQPAEVAEAMAALWLRCNPMWITRLEVAPRVTTVSGSRRRGSSTSSLQLPRSLSPAPGDSPAPVTVPEETVRWDWRATDLLERVPGRSPAAIVAGLLGSLHARTIDTSAPAGTAQLRRFSSLDTVALARFVELYARHRLTARASAALVPQLLAILRDCTAAAQPLRLQLPFFLRVATELCERIATNAHIDARKPYTTELAALYAQLADCCVLLAGRALDQPTWLRRSTADYAAGAAGPTLVLHSDPTADTTHVLGEDDVIDCVVAYFADMVVPLLALLVPDFERQVALATSLVQYAVTPAFRSHMTGGYSGPSHAVMSKSRHFALVLRCLSALAQLPSLLRVWRRELWDFFCDSKFFPPSAAAAEPATMSPALAPVWRTLLRTLMLSEKDRFTELLTRITSSSAAPALFANREHEAMARAIALRRLSFVIWCGSVNQYLSSLPHVQERLVDILKSSPHPAVQIEVFLCLRVLLCRISNHHMSNFWPMLLTELMRLCLLQLNRRDSREDPLQANLFLAACKFLDLLFILGTEDFLLHQWIFITDTIDALYASRSASHALLDRLSTRLLSMPSRPRVAPSSAANGHGAYPLALVADSDDPTNLVYQPISEAGKSAAESLNMTLSEMQLLGATPLKRPIIRLRSVSSIRELDAFVHNASVQTYQATYTLAEPDLEFIDAILLSDLLYFDFSPVSATSPSSPSTAQLSGFGDDL
ncbi:hypothetical protein H4R24_005314 [Coemansia sp. RSA 988]|nr:hypothetical protein H4R24_005314 [Coemansia sp. RSA 988]